MPQRVDPLAPSFVDRLSEHLHQLWLVRWLVMASCVLGLLLGVAYWKMSTPQYRASAALEIAPVDDVSTSPQTHVLLLGSGSFRNRVLERLQHDLEPEPPPVRSGWFGWNSAREFSVHAAGVAADTLTARLMDGTRIVSLNCESPSPAIAAKFLNLVAEEYMAFQYGEVAKSRQEAGVGAYSQHRDDPLDLLRRELSAAQAERAAKESRYVMAASQPPEVLPDFLADAGLRALRQRLADYRRELDILSQAYAPASERVRRMRYRIADAEATFDRERRRVLERMKTDFEGAKRHEGIVQSQLQRQMSAAPAPQPRDGAGQVVTAPLPERPIRIVDAAVAPRTPVSPAAPESLLMGLGAGLFLVNAFVFFRQRGLAARVGQPGHSSSLLAVRELGVVPSTVRRPPGRAGGLRGRRPRALAAPADEDSSTLRQSMRIVLTSLIAALSRTRGAHVFIISSPHPGEGKSTIAYHMGMALAAGSGFPTLIIDGDCYRPQMHRLFSMNNECGWSNLVNAPGTPSGAQIERAIQKASAANLSVICAGTATSTHFLDPVRVREILGVLRSRYRFILIDMPALLHTADARLTATETDGVVLVLRSGLTPTESAVLARQQLTEDGTPLLGTILNDFVQPWNALPESASIHDYLREENA